MATGNIGQQFTESSNEIGRALKDRMHLVLDTDHFRPKPSDTWQILRKSKDPRIQFDFDPKDKTKELIDAHKKLQEREVPFEKYLVAGYLAHALDYLEGGKSKIGLKSGWPPK